ncbi:hypothetical protein BKI52_08975 [marine bacterium AO1-C]|nr:hypothetical protein BKI52_08975 [marine bacterium AO1-C]
MNINTLKKEIIRAYQVIYFHQEQEKKRRGCQVDKYSQERRKKQLRKIIQETIQSNNLEFLKADFHRCEGYFQLHPEARQIQLVSNYDMASNENSLKSFRKVLKNIFS